MDVGTAESKRVNAHDSTADGNRPVDDLDPAVAEGWDVRVWTGKVQVGGPDSSLQRQQHLGQTLTTNIKKEEKVNKDKNNCFSSSRLD